MIYNKVKEIFEKTVYKRAEKHSFVRFFTSDDFEGINKVAYTVKSSLGHDLKGYFYYYDNPKKDKIVVFDHGMFCGHINYFKEIERILKMGYLVYAYDHTGCHDSGGDSTGGFAQSLRDLDEVMTELKSKKELDGYEFYVVGHSWGGFSTLNIPALHKDVKKIVSISGFISPKEIIYQHLSGPIRIFAKRLLHDEVLKNPNYMEYSALDSLKDSSVKALILHAPNDHMVKYKRHFLKLKDAFEGKDGFEFLTVPGADHNPTYTLEANREKQLFYKKLKRASKKGQFDTPEGCLEFKASLNWDKITEQDDIIWGKIKEFLDK